MPAYLIRHAKGQHGDVLLQDPDLTVETTDRWAIFSDDHGICLIVPVEHVASIQRIDEPQDTPPKE